MEELCGTLVLGFILFYISAHLFLSDCRWASQPLDYERKTKPCSCVGHILPLFTVGHETSAPQLHQPGWAEGGVDFDLT